MKDAREMDRARSHGLRVAPIRVGPGRKTLIEQMTDEELTRLKLACERELRARKDRA